MGGRGSGRQAGFGFDADLCHRSNSIDLARLNKRHMPPGCWSTLTWSVHGEKAGSVGICRVAGGLKLRYRTRHGEEDWQSIEEVIPVIDTRTSFSGRRQWFECPSCRRRCRILYGGSLFRCRRCRGLRYETQYEPAFARAATRALKIRERLGDKGGIDDPFPERPKGMHRRTYERLMAQEERLKGMWMRGGLR